MIIRIPQLALLMGMALAAGSSSTVIEDALALAPRDRPAAIELLEAAVEDGRQARAAVMLHTAEQHRLSGDMEAAFDWFRRAGAAATTEADRAAAITGTTLVEASAAGLSRGTFRQLISVPADALLDTQNAERYALLAEISHAEGRYDQRDLQASRAVVYADGDTPTQRVIRARMEAMGARLDRRMARDDAALTVTLRAQPAPELPPKAAREVVVPEVFLRPTIEPMEPTVSSVAPPPVRTPEPVPVELPDALPDVDTVLEGRKKKDRDKDKARERPQLKPPIEEEEPPEVEDATVEDAREAAASGDFAEARRIVATILGKQPTDGLRTQAELVDRVAHGVPINADRIGVILPMTGRYASVSERIREAIEFGWSTYDTHHQLVFVDSGGTPDTAVAALDDLVISQGVVAVLGPLLSDETSPVVERAEALGVPLLSMSQALDDASSFTWVYQAWLTPRQQADALVQHIMADGMSRFAIFAPDSDYGHSASDSFRTAVQGRGGEIKIEVYYSPTATDMSGSARELGRKGGGGDGVAPVVDFDAIFLPERASRVPLAAAGLAYEEFPIGTFKPGGNPAIPLLGLSSWNSQDLVSSGGIYTRNGLFTDVFVPPPRGGGLSWSPGDGWGAFNDGFSAATDRSPSPIEVLGVDAGRFLGAVAATSPDHRAAFRDAVLTVIAKGSISGELRIDPQTRALSHEIRVLSVARQGFIPVE